MIDLVEEKVCAVEQKRDWRLVIAGKMFVVVGALLNTDAHATEVTHALVDGTVIETGDAVGSVRIRAKSLGVGFCATKVSARGKTTAIAAPPLTWSSWKRLWNHVGSAKAKISTAVLCDTGAIFQVKYFAK